MTLPSNSSMDCYPDNMATKYTTKLTSIVELDGEWEVGLIEISCPGLNQTIRVSKELEEILGRGETPLLAYFQYQESVQRVQVTVRKDYAIQFQLSLARKLGIGRHSVIAGTTVRRREGSCRTTDRMQGFCTFTVTCCRPYPSVTSKHHFCVSRINPIKSRALICTGL